MSATSVVCGTFIDVGASVAVTLVAFITSARMTTGRCILARSVGIAAVGTFGALVNVLALGGSCLEKVKNRCEVLGRLNLYG